MPEFAGQAEDGPLQILQDRLHARDWPALALAAAEVRRQYWDDPAALCHTATAWLAASRPADAATDAERAASLDPANGGAWYLLGLAQDELKDEGAALASLHRACVLEPDNPVIKATQAFCEARSESAWRAGFARLIEIHEAHPSNDYIRDLLVRAYLVRAVSDWTVVEASSGGATLVRNVAKVLRLGPDHDEIPPGTYPTTAQHVKTATECVNRAKALGSNDPELAAALAEMEAELEATTGRRYNATYGETGLSVVALLGGMVTLSGAPGMGVFAILAGSAMIAGSFEPQYRTNKIALSRMGKTVGDALIGVARGHQYGGLAYLFFLMMFFPAIAAYKLYLNRGEGWLVQADLPPLASHVPVPPDSEPAPVLPEIEPAPAVETIADRTSSEVGGAERPPPLPTSGLDREETGAASAAVPLGADSSRAVEIVAEADTPLVERDPVAEAVEPLEAPLPEPVPLPSSAQEQEAALLPAAASPGRSAAEAFRGFAGRARQWPSLSVAAAASVVVAGLIGLSFWLLSRSPGAAPQASAQAASMALRAPVPPPAPPAPTGPVSVSGSPQVVDTATLRFRTATVQVSGITGEGGVPARQMDSFIAEQGGEVVCQRLGNSKYLCRTPQGYDLAAAALVNGAARTSPLATDAYREMQAQAQANRKGIWQ